MIKVSEKDGKILCPLLGEDVWHIATPEERVRQRYIAILVNEYGYSIDQMAQEVPVNTSKRGTGRSRADIVIWKSKGDKDNKKNAFIVVECKAENVKIHIEDYFQGSNYAAWAGADFFVTTNEKETKYFAMQKEKLPTNLEEVVKIPTIKDINNDKIIEQIKNQTKTFTREEFTKTLKACHNVIRNNDKLSPEAAFDEISKILFMKIRYERDQKGVKVFTKKQYEVESENYEKNIRPQLKLRGENKDYMQWQFDTTKLKFKDDHLFEENDDIKIRENSFVQVLEKLENYNLSDTQDDVKGIAFEQFLGTTFRGELGQFFTPRTIVDFMTEVLDPQEGEVCCDPTCGSGGFLIKIFEYVREKIENDIKNQKKKIRKEIENKSGNKENEKQQLKLNEEIEEMQNALNKEFDTGFENSRMFNLSRNCIYGTDANPRMARTSKMNMIMHGDGHGGVHHHDGLLNVNGIFEERFDVILTNPPFGQNVDKKQLITDADKFNDEDLKKQYKKKYGGNYENALRQVDDHIGKPLLSLYDTGKMSTLTEVLFMERCLRLLKKGGRMGMVLPEGVLNNKNLQQVREYFEGRAKLILICSIPQDVFIAAGATVKPSLVFMKKFTEKEEKEYKKIENDARSQILFKYKKELDNLANEKEKLLESKDKNTKSKLKEITKKLDNFDLRIEEEIKPIIKQKFDYDIPIAKVDDAGITTTGAKSEGNQLPLLVKEYREYCRKNKLWNARLLKYKYIKDKDGYKRISDDEEVVLNG